MRRIFIICSMVAALGAGVALWFGFRDTDESKIKRTLNELKHIVSKRSGENPVELALRRRKVPEIFVPSVAVDFRHEMFNSRFSDTVLAGKLAQAHAMFEYLTLRIDGIKVLMDDNGRAVVYFNGTIEGKTRNSDRLSEVRDIFCRMELSDGKWKISEMSIRDVLEK